ncbi:MAG: hypothetical protein IPK19_04565 [Chloroflexi bacterium]|nr:hypothetical protein [Chloroflexota bacterium]
MTTAAIRFNSVAKRLGTAWRAFFSPGDFYAWLVAAGLLLAPALALQAAGWLVDLRTVLPIIVLSLVFGFLLARSQYNELLCLIISTIYGTCFTLLIAALNEPTGFGESIVQVFLRLSRWVYDAATGGINQDELVFTVLIAGLFWFLGFNLIWHIFRIDRVWRAILPPALILITNQVYYTGPVSIDLYLVAFLFLALLLMVRSALDAREWDWYVSQVRVPRKLRGQFYLVGVLFAAIVLLAAWIVPQRDLQDRLQRFQQFMQSETLMEMAELWNRLFTTAEMAGPTSDYYGGDSLQLGGAIRLGDQVVMLVSAPPGRRYYWKSRSFDVYDYGVWKSAAEVRLTDPEAPLSVEHEDYVAGARVPVQQTFTFALNASQLIYAAPEVLSVDLPTRTDLRFTPDENLVGQNMLISVIRPLRVLYRGDSYTATSLMSAASPDQLRSAGTDYPQWVRDLYSSYIPSITDRTISLANQIVLDANAVTPYDKAAAIETWLRTNIRYNELIPQPPSDRDSVDWFLFDLQEGYCNYYASAMVVMLRSLGVPARIAAGFAQGTYNPDERAYVIQERDAHTWVEVYFPGYGWVEFEPTAAQSNLPRQPGDSDAQPTAPPSPTATFTPTPLPSPTPTEPPTLPPVEGTPPTDQPTLTVTPQPTLTPSAVIVPTIPPQLPTPPDQSPLGFLLPIVAGIVLTLLLVLLALLVLVILYWYWEWRGLRGLSPVARAYARLERYAALLGLRVSTTQTPEERRRQYIRVVPRAEPPITAITKMYVVERYGRRGASRDNTPRGRTADRAWSDVRGNILGRLLSRLIPWRRNES